MKLFKIKCFLVNLLREICLTWLDITHNNNIFIIWMKALLWNKLNGYCLDTLYFLVLRNFLFRVCFSLNEGTEIPLYLAFWLALFWGCFLEFLSIIIILVSWGAVLDLVIPSWSLFDTKLSRLFFHFVFHLEF